MDLRPQIKIEADRCVMCGMCLPQCPTYLQTRDENESPRGRISLMNAYARGQLPLTPRLQGHLDRCLLCRSCERICPSEVAYGTLMDLTRAQIATERPVPPRRLDPVALTTRSSRRRVAALARLSECLGLRQLARRSGLLRLLGLTRIDALLPALPAHVTWRDVYPATAPARGEVQLFLGCVTESFDSATLLDAIRLLNALGYSVRVPAEQACCGAMHLHAGDRAAFATFAAANVRAFAGEATIVSCASGCGATLREYDRHTDDGAALATRVRDISDFIAALEWPDSLPLRPLPRRVLVHDPCSLTNVLRRADRPRQLLARIPQIELLSLADAPRCCGSAGRYVLDQPEMSDRLREATVDAIAKQQPDILVSANAGCAWQITAGLRARGLAIEVVHPVTLLARQMSSGSSCK